MNEIEDILEEELIEGCCSCRKGKGTDYALKLLRNFITKTSNYGMAIGNLIAQAASNLNLKEFDEYVTKKLGLKQYVRYVDDIVIISDNKKKLIKELANIVEKLKETNQKINMKKTNSQIGTLKKYNARKLILQYKTILPQKAQNDLNFDENTCKFSIK